MIVDDMEYEVNNEGFIIPEGGDLFPKPKPTKTPPALPAEVWRTAPPDADVAMHHIRVLCGGF